MTSLLLLARYAATVSFVLLFVVSEVDAAILRVGAGGGNFATLENAVTAAAPGDTIRVIGNGGSTYRVRVIADKPLRIEGGWRADFQVHDPSIYVSVLRDRDDAFDRAVISFQNAGNSVLEGFTIIGGRFGVESTNTTLALSQCEIRGQRNAANSGNPLLNRQGGCVRVLGGHLAVDQCTFRDAFSEIGGAGIGVVQAAGVEVTNSHFENLLSARAGIDASGAAMVVESSGTLQMTDCVVTSCATASDGGLIRVRQSGFIATNCEFSQGSASVNGGGIQILDGGEVRLTDCRIEDNVCISRGGGLHIVSCAGLFLTRCTIRGNLARQWGGGVSAENAPFTFVDCRWEANSRTAFPPSIAERGGGVRTVNSSGSATRCCFVGEMAAGWGGAWSHAGGVIDVRETVFDGNESNLFGGAFHIDLAGEGRFTEVLFRGNEAKYGGALAAGFTGRLAAHQCTFTENAATTSGAAVYLDTSAEASLSNSILCCASRGDLVTCAEGAALLRFCNVWNDDSVNPRVEFGGNCASPVGTNGNISVNPVFCSDSGSAPFCGTSPRFFALRPESPCRGVGEGGANLGWAPAADCQTQPFLNVESESWGRIKARYR